MFKPMTDHDIDRVFISATMRPDDIQGMSVGLFCSMFGLPTADQWADLLQVLCFDGRNRLCAKAGLAAASPRRLSAVA